MLTRLRKNTKKRNCGKRRQGKYLVRGQKDGKAFEGGSTGKGGTDIVLGASGYIAGFDDGVIGMKVGETKDLDLTFPEDYHEKSLAGQPVVFTVTLNYIIVPKTVKYDMDFIKSVSKAKSKRIMKQK